MLKVAVICVNEVMRIPQARVCAGVVDYTSPPNSAGCRGAQVHISPRPRPDMSTSVLRVHPPLVTELVLIQFGVGILECALYLDAQDGLW